MLKNPIDGKWRLVQVMACCCQQQDITWANVDPDLWHHMKLLCYNKLTHWLLEMTNNSIEHCQDCFSLNQVMAWCLMAPSHYLDQCWLTINKALLCWIHLRQIQWKTYNVSLTKMCLKITHLKYQPGVSESDNLWMGMICLYSLQSQITEWSYYLC